MKRVILIFFLCILVIGVSGCMNGRKAMYDRMVSYMNEKYDDKFEFITAYGGSLGSNVRRITVSSEKYPGKEISVRCILENDNEIYSDNYIGVKYEEQTRELIRSILQSCYGQEVFLIYRVNNLAMPPSFTADMSFDEYKAESGAAVTFTAIVKYGLTGTAKEEAAAVLKKKIMDAGLYCSGTVYFASDIEDFSSLTEDNYYSSYLELKTYDGRFHFNVNSASGFEGTWEEK